MSKNKFLIGAAIFLVTLSLAHLLQVMLSEPIGAAEKQAEILGWAEEDRVPSGGGYSSGVFSFEAYIRFHSKTHPEYGEILVMVRKRTPFSDWELAKYEWENRVGPPPAQGDTD